MILNVSAGKSGDSPTKNPLSPGPCYMYYMCYISQGNPLNIHSPRVPCLCYISQGNPLNIHSFQVPCYICYMCYICFNISCMLCHCDESRIHLSTKEYFF